MGGGYRGGVKGRGGIKWWVCGFSVSLRWRPRSAWRGFRAALGFSSPLAGRLLDFQADPGSIDGMGIKVVGDPFAHVSMALVIRIGDGFQELLVTGRPSTVFGR